MSTAPARAATPARALSPSEQRTDVVLAVVMLVGALISSALSSVAGIYGTDQAPMSWAVVYAFVVAAPLALRRRWPGTVAVIVAIAYFLAATLHVPELYAGNIAMFIAFYTVGAWSSDRRRAALVRVLIIIGMFVWLMVNLFIQATAEVAPNGLSRAGAFSPFVAYTLLNILINVLYFSGAYYFGENAYASARQRMALEQRTAELEREREVTAAQAVALDRLRIARELHDVVAHHVSLMGVQAGAARAVMTKDPDAATQALTSVEASARTALGELRQLLETLRSPGQSASDDPLTAPTTIGLAAIEGLVVEATAAGLPTTLTVIGDPSAVAETVQVNLYRIAQEALTNARRHAGPNATADVRLRYLDDGIELEVTNTGRLAASARPGLGQLGMRERAAASGGAIELHPLERGGFLVRVSVPAHTAPASPLTASLVPATPSDADPAN
ncbi:MAG: sensor histidine kinase, partial [Actinobacteria bacterium]|nr:sensor histidine kinase [Actinomycetota bacterium]